MPYDLKYFRTIRHGEEEVNAYCRKCNESKHYGDVKGWAKDHSRKTTHTVDVYQENHTEYTCHFKSPLTTLNNK